MRFCFHATDAMRALFRPRAFWPLFVHLGSSLATGQGLHTSLAWLEHYAWLTPRSMLLSPGKAGSKRGYVHVRNLEEVILRQDIRQLPSSSDVHSRLCWHHVRIQQGR